MADNGKERSEWDIVSLSSSTYTEPSESMFVFPPSEHENLPIEPEIIEPENINTEENQEEDEEEELEVNIEYEGSERVQFFEDGRRVSVQDSDEEPETEAGIFLEREKGSKKKVEKYGEKKMDLPCEAWWKRPAIYLYKNAKETNTIWSIFVASALMGIVILGHRWHKEKWELNSRWRINLTNERMGRILGRTSN